MVLLLKLKQWIRTSTARRQQQAQLKEALKAFDKAGIFLCPLQNDQSEVKEPAARAGGSCRGPEGGCREVGWRGRQRVRLSSLSTEVMDDQRKGGSGSADGPVVVPTTTRID